jgi:hypothetical protein
MIEIPISQYNTPGGATRGVECLFWILNIHFITNGKWTKKFVMASLKPAQKI